MGSLSGSLSDLSGLHYNLESGLSASLLAGLGAVGFIARRRSMGDRG